MPEEARDFGGFLFLLLREYCTLHSEPAAAKRPVSKQGRPSAREPRILEQNRMEQ